MNSTNSKQPVPVSLRKPESPFCRQWNCTVSSMFRHVRAARSRLSRRRQFSLCPRGWPTAHQGIQRLLQLALRRTGISTLGTLRSRPSLPRSCAKERASIRSSTRESHSAKCHICASRVANRGTQPTGVSSLLSGIRWGRGDVESCRGDSLRRCSIPQLDMLHRTRPSDRLREVFSARFSWLAENQIPRLCQRCYQSAT